MTSLIDLSALAEDIGVAQATISRFAAPTPLLRMPTLDRQLDAEIFLKAESLQPTGSFKLRGALYAMARLQQSGATEVVAFSSGNHGIGVAYAGRCLGMTATIVVPHDAPAAKIAFIESLGGNIVSYNRQNEDRETVAATLQVQRNAPLVKPYDDWHTIAGQGTCGLEVTQQTDIEYDSAIVCTGGGGLMAGVGTILKQHSPSIRLLTAEPEGWDDHRASLALGERVAAPATGSELCDGLLAPMPGELTFAVNIANGVTGLSVTDSAVKTMMRWAWRQLGLRLEPSGAVALAALWQHQGEFGGQRVLITLTGGNVDADRFAAAIQSAGETAQPNH